MLNKINLYFICLQYLFFSEQSHASGENQSFNIEDLHKEISAQLYAPSAPNKKGNLTYLAGEEAKNLFQVLRPLSKEYYDEERMAWDPSTKQLQPRHLIGQSEYGKWICRANQTLHGTKIEKAECVILNAKQDTATPPEGSNLSGLPQREALILNGLMVESKAKLGKKNRIDNAKKEPETERGQIEPK